MRLWFTNFSSADYRLFNSRAPFALCTFATTTLEIWTTSHFNPWSWKCNFLAFTFRFPFFFALFFPSWQQRERSQPNRRRRISKLGDVKAYITVFPLVTSHLIQLIALFSHFSWFFPFFPFTSHLDPSKTVFPSYYFLFPSPGISFAEKKNLFPLLHALIHFYRVHPYK